MRDVRCCGPGCSSTHTHRDHLVPHPLGPTSASNLGRVSPRCHRAKHAGWDLRRHPDGSVTWTSPLGRVYERPSPHEPPPKVDLWQDLPPLRPAPAAATRDDDTPPARPDDRGEGSRDSGAELPELDEEGPDAGGGYVDDAPPF